MSLESVNGFTIERLRAFCRVAEAGSIVQAAGGDPTRQSQFSRQVKELEEFFGTKLIERAGKTIKLTEDGRRLALLTQTYFRSVEELRVMASKQEVVRIGAGESVSRWLLIPRITELQNLAAGIRLEFHTQATDECVRSVKEGLLDFAIIRKGPIDEDLTSLPCGSMSYALVVPRKLLPGRTSAGFHLLQTIPFAQLTGDGAFVKTVLHFAAQIKVKFDVRLKAESFTLLVSAIEYADFAAVLPEQAAAELSQERFAIIETDEIKSIKRDLVLVLSPKAAELRQNVRRLAPRISSLFEM